MKRTLKMTMVPFSLLIFASCSSSGLVSNTGEDTISITGGITSEAQILASLVAGMVEHYTDKNTAIINDLATITINRQAMMNRGASISTVRYTGTDLTVTLNLPLEKDPKKAFEIVKDEFEKGHNQTQFPSYGSESTCVFLVQKDIAQKYHLSKVSDLKSVADELVAGVDTSWINRKGDGYDNFQETYGLSSNSILPMQTELAYSAAEVGKMGIALGCPMDGRVTSYDLVMLEDDRQFFPPYDAAPVIDNRVLVSTPHLKEALSKLGHTISAEKMQESNYKVDNNPMGPSVVARRFLQEDHYFEGK